VEGRGAAVESWGTEKKIRAGGESQRMREIERGIWIEIQEKKIRDG
jgi:hypothetical protein